MGPLLESRDGHGSLASPPCLLLASACKRPKPSNELLLASVLTVATVASVAGGLTCWGPSEKRRRRYAPLPSAQFSQGLPSGPSTQDLYRGYAINFLHRQGYLSTTLIDAANPLSLDKQLRKEMLALYQTSEAAQRSHLQYRFLRWHWRFQNLEMRLSYQALRGHTRRTPGGKEDPSMTPHQLRDGGASTDAANGDSDMAIQERGIWASAKSVLRYHSGGEYI